MSFAARTLYYAGLLMVLTGTMGCATKISTRRGFNETLATGSRDLMRAAADFRLTLKPLFPDDGNTKPSDPVANDVKAGYDKLVSQYNKVKATVDDLPLPMSSNSAKEYLEKYKDYLKVQKEIIDKDLKAVVDAVEDSAKNPTQKKREIMNVFAKINGSSAAEKALKDVRDAQDKFFTEHNFKGVERFRVQK